VKFTCNEWSVNLENTQRFVAAGRFLRGTDTLGMLPADIEGQLILMPYGGAKALWVVENEAGIVARLMTIISMSRPENCLFSFFEINFKLSNAEQNTILSSLLTAARTWAKSQNATTLVGPIAYNTWFPYRFRTDSHPLRFAWEPNQPAVYPKLFQEQGFKVLEEYHSAGYTDFQSFHAKTKSQHEQAITNGFEVLPMELSDQFIDDLYDLSSAGFRNNFLFEPLPREAFKALYVPIFRKSDLRYARVVKRMGANSVDGFFYMFEDQGYIVMKTVAVRDSARGLGLSNALTYACSDAALKNGVTKAITALVKSGAQSESYGKKMAQEWLHTYALFSASV